MPFASKAQQRYMEAHKAELEKKGVNLKEWEKATNFSRLPERKKATVKITRKP